MRLALAQYLHQVAQRHSAIDDVLDNQHIRALDRVIQILGDFHFAGAGLSLTVAGDSHEFHEGIALDGAGEVG